jgi:hypothetical protein
MLTSRLRRRSRIYAKDETEKEKERERKVVVLNEMCALG